MRHTKMGMLLTLTILQGCQLEGLKDADVMKWLNDGEGDDCLVVVRLPRGMKEALEAATQKACSTCPTKDCDNKDFMPSDFISSLLRMGLLKLALDVLAAKEKTPTSV